MIILAVSSGTSVDGIDVAVADIQMSDTDIEMTPLVHREVDFSTELSEMVLGALPPATTTLEQVCRIDTLVGQELAAAARSCLDHDALAGARPEVIVSHGQTLFHWVQARSALGTLQMGQPAWISEATGLPVISDVRGADVAAGGHGAPLASLMDVLLLGERVRPAAALNLGGIANVTVAGGGLDPVAFDTGPANALLDVAVHRATDGRRRFDAGGRLAAAGRVHDGLLSALGEHPYYRQAPPKSTGKEVFHADYLDEALRHSSTQQLPGEDLLATLVELTALTVAEALRPYNVDEVVASGGGTRNGVLMQRLHARLGGPEVTTYDSLGLDPGAKEAYLFALVGFLTWHGLPGTVPSCTGARHRAIAGRISPGSTPLRLPEPLTTSPTVLRVTAAPTDSTRS
ncbi:MAG: anhydro-N-acetylmuramic acid kinase [Ornithinimicrobium sp.]